MPSSPLATGESLYAFDSTLSVFEERSLLPTLDPIRLASPILLRALTDLPDPGASDTVSEGGAVSWCTTEIRPHCCREASGLLSVVGWLAGDVYLRREMKFVFEFGGRGVRILELWSVWLGIGCWVVYSLDLST